MAGKISTMALLILFAGSSPAAASGGKVIRYLGEKVPGCLGELKANVSKVDIIHTRDTISDILWDPPVGTWVTESGEVGQIDPRKEPDVRGAKFALLKGDRVEILRVDSSRRTIQLTLGLLTDLSVRSKLEVRLSRALRKDLSDIDRFWQALSNILDIIPDPADPERCGRPAGGEPVGNPATGR